MNQKNFDYLKDQVKYSGFDDVLVNKMKERMEKPFSQFHIVHDLKFGNEEAFATLHFKKSDQTDMLFFNKYLLSIKAEGSQEKLSQIFYMNNTHKINLKEAYNLLNGRAINKDITNKEGQLYNVWLKLDFKNTDNNGNYKTKTYHQNYGYDLQKVLANHPIKELTNEQDKTRLMESLQRGNRQSVTFLKDGNEQKVFIEANPQFKSINVYDGNMQRVIVKQSKGERETQGETISTKQEVKKERQNQSDADDSPEIPKASTKRKRKQGQSI